MEEKTCTVCKGHKKVVVKDGSSFFSKSHIIVCWGCNGTGKISQETEDYHKTHMRINLEGGKHIDIPRNAPCCSLCQRKSRL